MTYRYQQNTFSITGVSIDCTVAGPIKIATTPVGVRFVPIATSYVLDNVSGPLVVGNGPFVSVGTNAVAYDNIAANSQLNESVQYFSDTIAGNAPSIAPSTDIYVNVNTAAVPVNVTSYSITVFILGTTY